MAAAEEAAAQFDEAVGRAAHALAVALRTAEVVDQRVEVVALGRFAFVPVGHVLIFFLQSLFYLRAKGRKKRAYCSESKSSMKTLEPRILC